MPHTWALTILGYIALSLLSATAGLGAATGTLAEADALLNSPALSMTQAARALSLYEGLLATAGADRAVVLTHLGRTCFLLGQLAPEVQGMSYYQKGQSYAETLIREKPDRVQGHYWLALNLCGQAEVGSKLLGRKLLPRILEELQRAVALDAGEHTVVFEYSPLSFRLGAWITFGASLLLALSLLAGVHLRLTQTEAVSSL